MIARVSDKLVTLRCVLLYLYVYPICRLRSVRVNAFCSLSSFYTNFLRPARHARVQRDGHVQYGFSYLAEWRGDGGDR